MNIFMEFNQTYYICRFLDAKMGPYLIIKLYLVKFMAYTRKDMPTGKSLMLAL